MGIVSGFVVVNWSGGVLSRYYLFCSFFSPSCKLQVFLCKSSNWTMSESGPSEPFGWQWLPLDDAKEWALLHMNGHMWPLMWMMMIKMVVTMMMLISCIPTFTFDKQRLSSIRCLFLHYVSSTYPCVFKVAPSQGKVTFWPVLNFTLFWAGGTILCVHF